MSTQVDLFTNVEPTSVSPAIAKPFVSRSTFYQGDCLMEMGKIENKSVDMVLCDLPYGTTACKWDTIIPFKDLWEQYERICKDNAAILLFGTEPFSSSLRMSNISNFKYDWIWDKKRTTTPQLAKRMPLNNYEIISAFYKKQPTYNPQPYIKNTVGLFSNKKDNQSMRWLTNSDNWKRGENNSEIGYPRRIINSIGVMNNLTKDKSGLHPTQKPIELMEYLIKTYTNERDIVLDNCMGSGTTGVACFNLNRGFIGIEKDETYFIEAKKRFDALLHKKVFC